jgi:hypothetical protein
MMALLTRRLGQSDWRVHIRAAFNVYLVRLSVEANFEFSCIYWRTEIWRIEIII